MKRTTLVNNQVVIQNGFFYVFYVYVAKCSHTGYFGEKDATQGGDRLMESKYSVPEDIAMMYNDLGGEEHTYNIQLLGTQEWLKFKGKCGVGGCRVHWPVFRHSKNPITYEWIDSIYRRQEP